MISFDYMSNLKFRFVLIGVFASEVVFLDPAFTPIYSLAEMTCGIMFLNLGLVVTKIVSIKFQYYDIIISKLHQRYKGNAGGQPEHRFCILRYSIFMFQTKRQQYMSH